MTTITENRLTRLRLLHLVSPSLPLGSFAYSQGLEWAAEENWVKDETTLLQWIENLLLTGLTHLDLPLLQRLYQACATKDRDCFAYWSHYLSASRETRELREEERNRARALAALLPEWGIPADENWLALLKNNQLSGYAYVAQSWGIKIDEAAEGYLWSWLENITLAGLKIIPLGQMAGQRILHKLQQRIPARVETGLSINDDEIGLSSPAQAIASSLHETQYTRIFRS
jgi:urease accessory protein